MIESISDKFFNKILGDLTKEDVKRFGTRLPSNFRGAQIVIGHGHNDFVRSLGVTWLN